MTASAKTSPKHHRIRSLEVTGGFLQGIKMDFSDGLNCVIGGRGTGKTTVLEALRYSLELFERLVAFAVHCFVRHPILQGEPVASRLN